jgi:putative ABC transport system permease protein
MKASALARKSWRELTRRRARAVFTIATVATAVAALWMFAIPQLTNAAMADRVEEHKLEDVLLSPSGFTLADSQLDELRKIPNVAGFEARSRFTTALFFGDQRQEAWVVGVRDFAEQEVNVVTVDRGEAPGPGQVLVDTQNLRSNRLEATIGDEVRLGTIKQTLVSFTVSGEGGTLRYSDPVRDGMPVVYVPLATVEQLVDNVLYWRIELRVHDRDQLPQTVAAVRTAFASMVPDATFETVADVRTEGDWPGRETMENIVQLFYILASLAAASALFMVYTTMNAVAREQTEEIAIMKAVGGRRRQIAGVFVRSALIIGAIGTSIGLIAGFILSNLLLQLIADNFMTITPGWGISWTIVVLSLAVGLVGSALASLPALRRAVQIPVSDALRDPGIRSGFGAGKLDRALQQTRFLPRMSQVGLRNTARRKGASLATSLQVGVALGIGLGLVMLAATVLDATEGWRAAEGGDIEVGVGRQLEGVADTINEVEGVAAVEGVYFSTIGIESERATLLGLPAGTAIFGKDVRNGRWFTPEEEARRGRVGVIGRPLAEITGLGVGDVVSVETPGGTSTLEVIGIDGNMMNDGKTVFIPIETHYELDMRTTPNWYWIKTTSDDEGFIDRVGRDISTHLARFGIAHSLELNYIDAAASRSEERMILGIIGILGIPIAAIGMIGLASSMTMSVLERTREIGILRSIGGRARDVRRMIRAEGIALTIVGWVMALPIGYLIGRALLWVIGRAFHNTFGEVVPFWSVLPALVIALLLAVWIVRSPARRAIRLSPGKALRYE